MLTAFVILQTREAKSLGTKQEALVWEGLSYLASDGKGRCAVTWQNLKGLRVASQS